jgi:hypothetical protein
MTSIVNLFSNFNDLTKPKSVTDNVTDYKAGVKGCNEPSPALLQGKKFKKFQSKITNNLEKRIEKSNLVEGFGGLKDLNLNKNGLTQQTNNLLNQNNFTSEQQTLSNLKNDYENTLSEYQALMDKINGNVTNYINRVNPNNPYLNKVVQFTTGHVCYVTNQGLVKWIPSMEIWQSLSIPQNVEITLTIPWLDSYYTTGTEIATTPPLVSGTNVEMGQSFGAEGSNVFVNKFLPENITPSYIGCFAASPNNDNMTFIGDRPPSTDVSIQNGNFSQSQIPNNTYKYLTWDVKTVPGWNFNCVLANNSTAWAYPMPYPNGNQCASIQTVQQLWTNNWIEFNTGVTYTLSFSACGRNCCDGSGKSNPINIGLEGTTIYTLDATVNQWKTYSFTFTVDSSGGKRISFIGTWRDSDRSTAIQGVSLSGTSVSSGSYTYNDCEQAAIQQGYRYFALQNVNTSTSKGYCAVTNSSPAVSQYGDSTVQTGSTALWSSNTSGQNGNTALLDNDGALNVLNETGTSVFSTPVPDQVKSQQGTYLGCFKLKGQYAKKYMIGGTSDFSTSFDDCQNLATTNGFPYFGVEGHTSSKSDNPRRCLGFSDSDSAKKYGISKKCKSETLGGGNSVSLYSLGDTGSPYFIILQDDGNMVIYAGTGPNDNQGAIWSSETNGKQQQANPSMAASKGKYGQNWMPSTGTLAPGDFIGSTSGDMALVMQTDGNLVLYTYQMGTNCQKMNDGNMGGGELGNAAYDIGKTAVPGNVGKLAYIDANAELHSYPTNNTKYSNEYTTYTGTDSAGYDIPGAAYGNATVEQCQNTCNSNDKCAGFAFSNNVCYPKTSDMYPNGSKQTNTAVNLYTRNKIPITPPTGVSPNTNSTDTVTYQNYINGGNLGSSYGLANATTVQKQQLEQMQSKLNSLTSQINGYTNKFSSGNDSLNSQSSKNLEGLGDYLKDFQKTNDGIKNFNAANIENILKDSDITVLQKNYDYLFWSILAAGTVLITMNIAKKQ